MKHNIAQNQKFLQKFALTPQMRQSIQLLSMSTTELHEFVDTAVAQNPFLKKETSNDGARTYQSNASAQRTSNIDDYASSIPQDENPRAKLISQVRIMGLEGKDLEIAEYLIYEMDDNGYIALEPEEAAETLSVKIKEIENIVMLIQGMEPAGIGARNVCECLQLQLKRQGKSNSLEYTMVSEFLNEIARNDIEKIAKALQVEQKAVKHALGTIKKLNPRPTSNIFGKEAPAIIPDLIAQVKDKKLTLRLNKDWLPQLRLYNPYANTPDIVNQEEAKNFIKKNQELAKALMENLKRREETLYKVTEYILSFQQDNLAEKERFIKTLTINDVAKALGMHASTISRTVSNKFIQFNNNAIPLRAFLSKGVRKEDGQVISKSAIKKKIEILVRHEDKKRPLSDEAIKKELAKENITAQRRTIAKYRNAMRILPAHLRRKVSP